MTDADIDKMREIVSENLAIMILFMMDRMPCHIWTHQSKYKEESGESVRSLSASYLDMLQKAGLLLSERHGKWTYYRRNEEMLAALSDYFGHEI